TTMLDRFMARLLRHHEAERIAVLEGRGHLFQRGARENPSPEQRLLPAQQIFSRGVESAGGKRNPHVDVSRVDRPGGAWRITTGALRHDGAIRVVAAMVHTQRGENILSDE